MRTVRRLAFAITAALVAPRTHGITDEGELEQLLADGQIDALDFAHCPAAQRTTAHALHADGSQTCLGCGHTLNGVS